MIVVASTLDTYVGNPARTMMNAAKRVLQYVKDTVNIRLVLRLSDRNKFVCSSTEVGA